MFLGASVGIAMGEGGSAMTVQAADVVILSDNLLRIPSTIEICRVARFVIFENCFSAISIKVIAVILAAVGKLSCDCMMPIFFFVGVFDMEICRFVALLGGCIG